MAEIAYENDLNVSTVSGQGSPMRSYLYYTFAITGLRNMRHFRFTSPFGNRIGGCNASSPRHHSRLVSRLGMCEKIIACLS